MWGGDLNKLRAPYVQGAYVTSALGRVRGADKYGTGPRQRGRLRLPLRRASRDPPRKWAQTTDVNRRRQVDAGSPAGA
jgi:hypothetical protein